MASCIKLSSDLPKNASEAISVYPSCPELCAMEILSVRAALVVLGCVRTDCYHNDSDCCALAHPPPRPAKNAASFSSVAAAAEKGYH
jgi:hypothetical protein